MSDDEDIAGGLIAALADEGQHVDDGGFTLDPAAALRKLREHQLVDPNEYILLLVEAAWLAVEDPRRGRLRVQLGLTTSVEFVGVAFERGSLRELFGAVFGDHAGLDGEASRRARVLQLLGLATTSALALEPRQIRITASDARGSSERLTVGPNGELTVEDGPPGEPSTVRWELIRRIQDVPWFVHPELRVLEQRCRFTALEVVVDGANISEGPGADLRDPNDRISTAAILHDGRTIGLAGLTRDPKAPARAWIVNRGVAFRDPDAGSIAGVQAVVEVDLAMDLSRKQLLEGGELESIRAAIRAARERLPRPAAPEPARKPAPKPAHDQLHELWRRLVLALVVVPAALLLVTKLSERKQARRARAEAERLAGLERGCLGGSAPACEELLNLRDFPTHEQWLEAAGRACATNPGGRWCEPLAEDLLRNLPGYRRDVIERGFEALCRADYSAFCSLPDGPESLARLFAGACEARIPGACRELLDRGLVAALPTTPTMALVRECVAGQDHACVRAAWTLEYGFVDDVELRYRHRELIEALLRRACSADEAACELLGRQLWTDCVNDDAVACYALALEARRRPNTPELIVSPSLILERLDEACTLALPEGCYAAGVVRARELDDLEDLAGAERDFARGCALDHAQSCAAEQWARQRAAIAPDQRPPLGPEGPSFPPPTPPAGAKPWSP